MKKRIVLCVLICLSVFSISAGAKTYEGEQYGYVFTVEVPDSWTVKTEKSGVVFRKEKDDFVAVNFYPPYPEARSMEETLLMPQMMQKYTMKMLPDAQFEPLKMGQIAKQNATISNFSLVSKDGVALRKTLAYFLLNDRIMSVLCSTSAAAMPEETLAVMNSLAFKEMTASEWAAQGYREIKQRNFAQAADKFRAAAKLDPKDSANFYWATYALIEDKQYDAALKEINQALELKPKNPLYLSERVQCYIQLKQPQAALADSTKLIELNPDSAHYYSARGNAYALQKKYREALVDFEKCNTLKKAEQEYAPFNIAQCHEMLGNKEEALKNYQLVAQMKRVPDGIMTKVNARLNGDWASFAEWL